MGRATAIYVRVSSRKQDLASQLPDLERWAKAQDGEVRWFMDKFTGKTMDRPGFAKLMASVEARKVTKIVIWRLDRLGRTAKGLTALFSELRERGVGLVSLRDGLDLETPAGRLMANVLASLAEYENEVRSERVLAGQAAARAKGKKIGRSAGPGRRTKVTPEQERLAKEMKGRGEKVAAIARATGLSRPTVYDILRTP